MLSMVSMETKVVWGDLALDKLSENLTWMNSEKGKTTFIVAWPLLCFAQRSRLGTKPGRSRTLLHDCSAGCASKMTTKKLSLLSVQTEPGKGLPTRKESDTHALRPEVDERQVTSPKRRFKQPCGIALRDRPARSPCGIALSQSYSVSSRSSPYFVLNDHNSLPLVEQTGMTPGWKG